jgi:hypothetical protein
VNILVSKIIFLEIEISPRHFTEMNVTLWFRSNSKICKSVTCVDSIRRHHTPLIRRFLIELDRSHSINLFSSLSTVGWVPTLPRNRVLDTHSRNHQKSINHINFNSIHHITRGGRKISRRSGPFVFPILRAFHTLKTSPNLVVTVTHSAPPRLSVPDVRWSVKYSNKRQDTCITIDNFT